MKNLFLIIATFLFCSACTDKKSNKLIQIPEVKGEQKLEKDKKELFGWLGM